MPANLTSILIVTGVVGLCVLLHYETMVALTARIGTLHNHRLGLLATMFALLTAHTAQIWIFALAYWASIHWFGLGAITPPLNDLLDAAYFSAMIYTTVGFGDLIPSGPLRMLASGEALAGLALITWSASFTFLRMQELWGDR